MLNCSRSVVMSAVLVLILSLAVSVVQAGDGGLFLWQARSDTATVYLLGSMHLAKPELYPLDRAIEKAWAGSPALVVEVNLDTVDMVAMQATMLGRGMYGPEETLKGSVSEETWAVLEAYLEARGLTTAGFGSMKPWFLAMVFSVTEMTKAGYQEQLGIDRHFLDSAAAQGKPVFELETGDFQLELLSGFDNEMQEMFLVSTLKEIDDFEGHMETMVSAWSSGDTGSMEELFTQSVREDKRLAPLMEKVIYERNETMARKIAGYLTEGKSCFVVVGAAHLAGKRSIVDHLQRMGGASWTVTRVSPEGRPAKTPLAEVKVPEEEPAALPAQ